MISGTLRVTVIAMIIALPLGLVTAIYLSEFASYRIRNVLKPTLEVIAGIPTVVLGYFAILVISPSLQLFSGGASTPSMRPARESRLGFFVCRWSAAFPKMRCELSHAVCVKVLMDSVALHSRRP